MINIRITRFLRATTTGWNPSLKWYERNNRFLWNELYYRELNSFIFFMYNFLVFFFENFVFIFRIFQNFVKMRRFFKEEDSVNWLSQISFHTMVGKFILLFVLSIYFVIFFWINFFLLCSTVQKKTINQIKKLIFSIYETFMKSIYINIYIYIFRNWE